MSAGLNGLEHVPEAGGNIVSDQSRIARRLGKVVDRARRRETGPGGGMAPGTVSPAPGRQRNTA